MSAPWRAWPKLLSVPPGCHAVASYSLSFMTSAAGLTATVCCCATQIVVGYRLRTPRQTVINPKNKAARSLSRQTVDSVVVLAENFPKPEES